MNTKQEILNYLTGVIDPEVGINIVDLGLVYDVDIKSDKIEISMTMTSRVCPMGEYLREQAQEAVRRKLPGDTKALVNLVWDPPWTPEMMSDIARKHLGQS